jgi:hypothetical protein
MKIVLPVVLKDALHNLATDSGASDEYCKGIVVGAVATVVALRDCEFRWALSIVASHCPDPPDIRELHKVVPESWLKDFEGEYKLSHRRNPR